MRRPTAIRTAAILGFLGVALGAFGAHGLKKTLEANAAVGTWETAVLYHLIHAVAILALAQRDPVPGWPCRLMAVGVGIFSGSLYILSVTGVKWLGAVTPLGGLAFLAAWGLLLLKPGAEPKP